MQMCICTYIHAEVNCFIHLLQPFLCSYQLGGAISLTMSIPAQPPGAAEHESDEVVMVVSWRRNPSDGSVVLGPAYIVSREGPKSWHDPQPRLFFCPWCSKGGFGCAEAVCFHMLNEHWLDWPKYSTEPEDRVRKKSEGLDCWTLSTTSTPQGSSW